MSGRKKQMSPDDLDGRAEELAKRVTARARPEEDDEDDDERGEPTAPPESKRVVLDDDEDDDEAAEPARTESARERSRERSRERGRLHRENEELRRRLEEVERRAAQPVVVHAPPQPAPGKSPEDEAYEREMRALVAEADQLEARSRQVSARKDAAGNVVGATPEELSRFREEWVALEQRRIDLMTQRSLARHGGGRPGVSTPEQVNQAILMGEYGDVFRPDERGQPSAALRWSAGYHQQLIAEGAPNDLATARKALAAARSRFNTAPSRRPAPSPERRSRYESISRGGGGNDGEGESRPRSVNLTQKQMQMAEDRWPNLPHAKAHKLYAERVVLKRRDSTRA